MKGKYLWIILSSMLFACQSPKKNDGDFDAFSKIFIEDLWKQYPNWALSVGYHVYDSILEISDDETRKAQLEFSNRYLKMLDNFDIETLSATHKTDYYLIKNFLSSRTFYNELKAYEWNPSDANYGNLLFEIFNNNKATLAQKVTNASKFLSRSVEYYTKWKKQLKIPTKEHNALAISQLQGTIAMMRKDIADSFLQAKADTTVLQQAVRSIQDFIVHLQSIASNIQSGKIQSKSFRIGKDLFSKKFEVEIQSSYTAEEIYKKALAEKQSIHQQMFTYAQKLAPLYIKKSNTPKDTLAFIKSVIDAVSRSHIDRTHFQDEIVRQIPILSDFVRGKNLLNLDSSKPLEVRKEPEWMAGIAGASISSPGPYDSNGKTFYNVGSLASYSPSEAESFLREYNQYTLQILNIHEAIPGHYVQLLHSNASPSLVQAILLNGAMIEGWAVYAERMMMEAGWDNNTTINKVASPDEMWLMYLKWRLRVCCNTILDYSVHVLDMTEEEALHLLQYEAFQEKKEAQSKWKRSTLSQVQLCSYFTGYTEIYELREKIKKENKNFDLKTFHEQLLNCGSAPVKYISSMMR